MPKKTIIVKNLSKSYQIGAVKSIWSKAGRLFKRGRSDNPGHNDRTFWALKDISFEVAKGETLGVIGPNGAGKSTLLKILCGVTQQTSGDVTITDRVVPLIELGAGFHPELTGRENIYLNATIMGLSKTEIDKRFDEIVAFSELEQFIDTPVKRYSSGMFVRLAFAVMTQIEPEVLLVDEVLSVGDWAFQKKSLQSVDVYGRAALGHVKSNHYRTTKRLAWN